MRNKLLILTLILISSPVLANNKPIPPISNDFLSVDLNIKDNSVDSFELKEMINSDYVPKAPLKIKHQDTLKKLSDVINEIFDISKKTPPQSNNANNLIDLSKFEKRDKPYYEDSLISIIERMPKYTYQYFGPYLHSVPYISEKILNIPGIKETEGQFPTRIAPQMKTIAEKYRDFLSPALYFILMPEAFKTKEMKIEESKYRPFTRTSNFKRNDTLYKRAIDSVDIKRYLNGRNEYTPNMTRTKNPDLNSPLTDGDVIAFANSILDLRIFGAETKERKHDIRRLGYILNNNYTETGKLDPTGMMKDIANPCQRLAQRIKLLGLETEFNSVLVKHGFNTDSWAYTCDKTIKAYRLANMNISTLFALKSTKFNNSKGYARYLTKYELDFTDKSQALFLEMFNATENDRKILWHNKDIIKEQFAGHKNNNLLSLPVFLLN